MTETSWATSRDVDDKQVDVKGVRYPRTNRPMNTHQRQLRGRRQHRKPEHDGKDASIFTSRDRSDVPHLKSTKKSSKNYGKGRAAVRKKASCCENGGQCVLGSFCVCPKEFFGRYCQFELGKADCGSVKHLSWVKQGCDLCHCYDGKSSCLPKVFDNCGNSTIRTQSESSKQVPFFQPSAKFRDDYPYLTSSDDMHAETDDYYSDDEAYSSCNDVSKFPSSLLVSFTCFYITTKFLIS